MLSGELFPQCTTSKTKHQSHRHFHSFIVGMGNGQPGLSGTSHYSYLKFWNALKCLELFIMILNLKICLMASLKVRIYCIARTLL